MTFSFSRSRDQRGQRLRRRWFSLIRPTTSAFQPAAFLLTLLLPVPRSPSPFIVLSATLSKQKKNTTSPPQSYLPYAGARSRRQPAKTLPVAVAAEAAAVVPALPYPHPLYGSAAVSATRLDLTTNLVHHSIGGGRWKIDPSAGGSSTTTTTCCSCCSTS